MKTITYILTTITTLSIALHAAAQCTLTRPAKVPLGANLLALTDYSRDRPFNDVFKTSRPTSGDIQHPYNSSTILLDKNGWPLQDFGVVVMTNMDTTMGGIYKIQFSGTATIQPVGGSNFTVSNQSTLNNITTANLNFPQPLRDGSVMMIAFTNTRFSSTVKGIKNIKIMKPGLAFNAPTFSTTFLNHLSRFDCIRCMDWRQTNGAIMDDNKWHENLDSLWIDRTKKTWASQQQPLRGVAWEYVIELAKTLNKNLWINIPHKADNNYISSLARLLRDSLPSNLNIYVEYSNEVWNSFPQQQWVNNQASIEGSTPGSAINFDNVNKQDTWSARYVAKRSKEISDLFRTIFGVSAINTRVRVVLPQWFANFDLTVRGVEFINAYPNYDKPNKYFYALCVAPYFATRELDEANSIATPSQILDELEYQSKNLFPQYLNYMDMWAARAAFFGLKLIAYEGGPDTYGPSNINSKIAANRDPRMKTICVYYLNNWYKYGYFGLFNWYAAGAADYNTQYGTWALTENFENSQKLQAIEAVHNGPVPSFSAGQDTLIDPRKYAGYDASSTATAYFQPPGNWIPYYEYLIRVPHGIQGIYKLILKTCADRNGQTYKVQVDNNTATTITPVSNNFLNFLDATAFSEIQLPEGFHAIRITPVGGTNFRIATMLFSLVSLCTGLASSTVVASQVNEKMEDKLQEHSLIIPNLLHGGELWKINGLSNNNSISIVNTAGQVIFKTTSYQNNASFSNYTPGLYFYQVITINSQGKQKIYKGKLIVTK